MIFYLIGKTASGKNSIASELMKRVDGLQLYIPYTTRPRRSHEVDGRDYHFITISELEKLESAGKIIEKRVYNTIHGPWTYATIEDDILDEGISAPVSHNGNVLMIGTLESFRSVRNKYGADALKGLYIECEDGLRLQRALDREKEEVEPKYKELCRRFLADEEDYSPENVKKSSIDKVFRNEDFFSCVGEIEEYIRAAV